MPSYYSCKQEFVVQIAGTYIFGINNGWITTIVAKFSDVLEHVCQFLADAARNGRFEDFTVETLIVASHPMDFSPQGCKFVPAN